MHNMPHTLYLFHKTNRVEKLKTNHSRVCKKFLNTLSVWPQKRHLTMHYFTKNSTSLEQASNEQTKLVSKLSLAVFPKHANQSHASWFALSFNACAALWEQTEIWNWLSATILFQKRICSLVIEIMLTFKNSAIFEQFFIFSKTISLKPSFFLAPSPSLLYTNKI